MQKVQGFDPLVSNGILYAPVDTILNGTMPPDVPIGPCGSLNNPAYPSALPQDVFTPSAPPQQKKSYWKTAAVGLLLATLAFFGLKKFGINPFKKLMTNPKVQALKTFCGNQLTKMKATNLYKNIQKGCGAAVGFVKNLFSRKAPTP